MANQNNDPNNDPTTPNREEETELDYTNQYEEDRLNALIGSMPSDDPWEISYS